MTKILPDTHENYAVDTDGTVYRIKSGKYVPLVPDISTGVARVSIFGKRVAVHKLIAEAFVARNFPAEKCVCHLDGDKLNNRAENLRWMTQSECNLYSRALKR